MNISENIERGATYFPDKTAIMFEGKQLTYRELNDRVQRLANGMKAHGIARGDRLALYLPNIPEFAIGYLAAVRAGAVAVSVNAMYKAGELRYILDDAGCKAVLTISELIGNIPLKECPTVEHVLVCEGTPQGHPSLEQWEEKGSGRGTIEDMHPDEPAALLYTSGTTGFPKGAILTHGNVVSNMWATVHHAGFTAEDRMILFLPLFHVFGQNFIMNSTFLACGTIVLHRRFAAEEVLDSMQRNRVTMFIAVPTIYIGLLNVPEAKKAFASVRYEFSAAATLPREISARWTERFKRPVFEGYGLTECSPFACYNHDFTHKFGSIGTPVQNTEVRIFDEEDNPLAPGNWGEICIRGPGVMKGYYNKPDETEKALRNGWLHSGDIGMTDEEGFVFIVDRVKDMINVSGFKVWPAELEQYLYEHPAVHEVAVYGVPDPAKGEAVVAAIVPNPGVAATQEEIKAWCKERIAAYKTPSRVEFVDELPKSPTGKILKRVLREEG